MLTLIEKDNTADRIQRDPRHVFIARLKRVFRDYPGAIVVRTERHHDPLFGPRAYCSARGRVPLAAHCEDGITETAFSYSVFEDYIRYLSRLAAVSPDGWTNLPTIFWEDPDRYGGYCQMPVSLAA